MSEPTGTQSYDTAWATALARSRGLDVDAETAEQLVAIVAPVLTQFAGLAQELASDDDMYEFRRLLAEEARRA